MIKILSIGNSFSQDAQRYLYQLARSEGVKMKCMNLYIGGCPLRTHYINMLQNSREYILELNGSSSGVKVSMSDALASDDWDYVTLQQGSILSSDYKTYQPYLSELASYVRKYAPKAKLLIHQTWAYKEGCDKLTIEAGFNNSHEMLDRVLEAYNSAYHDINADGIIPCGEAMMSAIEKGADNMHRDSLHVDLGMGRYLLALVWYMTITGNKPSYRFDDFDVPVEADKKALIESVAEEICFK